MMAARGVRIAIGLVVLTLPLSSCGKGEERRAAANSVDGDIVTVSTNDAGPLPNNIAAPLKDMTAEEAGVCAVVDGIYRAYGSAGMPPPLVSFSPDFIGARDRAAVSDAAFSRDDIWCDCAEAAGGVMAYDVKSIAFAPDGGHARAMLSLDPGRRGRPVAKWIDLVRTPKGWLVDDVSGDAGASLKAAWRRAVPVPANSAG